MCSYSSPHVRAVFEVDVPRPRRLGSLIENDRANEIKMEALSLLHEEAMKSFSRGSKAPPVRREGERRDCPRVPDESVQCLAARCVDELDAPVECTDRLQPAVRRERNRRRPDSAREDGSRAERRMLDTVDV